MQSFCYLLAWIIAFGILFVGYYLGNIKSSRLEQFVKNLSEKYRKV